MANYTSNYNLEKPLQEEFYDVDVQNSNMEKIDTAMNDIESNREMKTFVSLEAIGLTRGSETIESIVNTLPDCSMLTVATDGNYNLSIYPDELFGLLTVIKRTSSRTLFIYTVVKSEKYYFGHYYSVDGSWHGWTSFLPLSGGELTGDLTIKHSAPALNLTDTQMAGGTKIHKNADSSYDYGTYIADIGADGLRDILVLRKAGETNSKLFLRLLNEDGETYTIYYLYGEHNKPSADDLGVAPKAHASTATTYGIGTSTNYGHVKLTNSVETGEDASSGVAASAKAVKSVYDAQNKKLPLSGGTLTNNLDFKKVDNGYGRIAKNHSTENDYGTYIADFDADENSAKLSVCARTSGLNFTLPDGTICDLSNPIIDSSISDKVITLTFADGTTKTLTVTNDYAHKLPYATCSTAKTTAAKVATITNSVSFSLVAGATVTIKFTNGLSSNNIYNNFDISTLNVNSTGAKTVKLRYVKGTQDVPPYHNNNTYQFVYDGTYWNEVSGLVQRYNTAAGN